jgi:serralysin
LVGGSGRDILSAGAGNDFFVFENVSDSGITATTQDFIADFTKGEDRIDVREIDARTIPFLADDAFLRTIIQGTSSTSFNGVQGQIIWFKVDNANNDLDRTIIRFNTDTDKPPEMQIELMGLHNLTAADFLL